MFRENFKREREKRDGKEINKEWVDVEKKIKKPLKVVEQEQEKEKKGGGGETRIVQIRKEKLKKS